MLLQLPAIDTGTLCNHRPHASSPSSSSSSSSPAAAVHGAHVHGLHGQHAGDLDCGPPSMAAAGGSWRRRAMLLIAPGLVQACMSLTSALNATAAAAGVAAGADTGQSTEICSSAVRSGGGSGQRDEVQALLASALAPLLMPGGGGWRLQVEASHAGHAPANGRSSSPTTAQGTQLQLSIADAVTAANVFALKPRAILSTLPSQLAVQPERLMAPLQAVAAAVAPSADRVALAAVQQLAPVLAAMVRAAGATTAPSASAGLGLRSGVDGRASRAGVTPSWRELLQQVRYAGPHAMPSSQIQVSITPRLA